MYRPSESTYNISGPNLSPKKREELIENIQEDERKSMIPIEGEIPKTADHLRTLTHVNELIAKECERLGVPIGAPLLPEQVHILPPEAFRELFGDGHDGVHQDNAVYLMDTPDREKFEHNLLHEALHPRGFQRYYADVAADTWFATRGGYGDTDVVLQDKRPVAVTQFQSLNEAVVERLAIELDGKPNRRYNDGSYLHTYLPDRILLEAILTVIARHRKEDIDVTWQRFKHGYFAGNMLHLRALDQALQSGTLRRYANISAGDDERIIAMIRELDVWSPQELAELADRM